MSLGSRGSSSSSTTNTETFNLGSQGVEGHSVAAVGSTVQITDAGLAQAAIESSERNLDVVVASQEFGLDRSYDFGERALDHAADAFTGAREDSLALVDRVIDVVSDTGDRYLGAVERFQSRESGNTDARLEGVTNKVLYLGGAVALVGVLAALYVSAQKRAA